VVLTWWWGKDNIWFVDGAMITFALGAIYALGSFAVLKYFWTERRSEFNWILHGVFPVVSIAAIALLWYKSLNPWPAAPFKWGPVTAFVWFGLGIIVIAILAATGKEAALADAGAAVDERPETPEELAHRPSF
jgi:amino acid transporter